MYKLLLALVLLNVGCFVEAVPVNDTFSVYNTIKSHSEKCPYLHATVLKTEPDFLKPCTNFSRISSIVSISDGNIKDVRCAIYYNYLILLCATVDLKQEEITHYFNKERIEASLKNNTVVNVCEILKREDRKIETVDKSMNIIMPLLQSNEICHRICGDFTNNLYPACNEAAYMIQVIIMHNTSVQNSSKSSGTPANAALTPKTNASSLAKQPETSLQANLEQVQQIPAKIKQTQQNVTQIQNMTSKTTNNNNKPGFEIAPEQIPQQPAISKNDTQKQDKSVLNKMDETGIKSEGTHENNPAISAPSDTKVSNNTKLGEDEVKTQAESLSDKQKEVKTIADNKPHESEKNKITPEKNEPLASAKNEPLVPAKNEPLASAKNEPLASAKNEPLASAKNEHLIPDKSNPVISEKDETIVTAPETDLDTIIDFGGEDEGARREDYQESDEVPMKQVEEVKQPEVAKQPEANKQPEGKLKTPKPEETVDDDVLLSASYNQHMDEDDSYFFSYFMMICVVFILAYVAYHNKQKVFALVLEGRRGRRPSRSRRPNSANYHKLDSNLEEAVSSSCNKNTTHIIY